MPSPLSVNVAVAKSSAAPSAASRHTKSAAVRAQDVGTVKVSRSKPTLDGRRMRTAPSAVSVSVTRTVPQSASVASRRPPARTASVPTTVSVPAASFSVPPASSWRPPNVAVWDAPHAAFPLPTSTVPAYGA